MSVVIVTGGDAHILCIATKNGDEFVIDPGATVQAALISLDRQRVLIPAVTCDVNHAQADWAASSVAVVFPKELTAALTEEGAVTIELKIVDVSDNYWFFPALIAQGHIN